MESQKLSPTDRQYGDANIAYRNRTMRTAQANGSSRNASTPKVIHRIHDSKIPEKDSFNTTGFNHGSVWALEIRQRSRQVAPAVIASAR